MAYVIVPLSINNIRVSSFFSLIVFYTGVLVRPRQGESESIDPLDVLLSSSSSSNIWSSAQPWYSRFTMSATIALSSFADSSLPWLREALETCRSRSSVKFERGSPSSFATPSLVVGRTVCVSVRKSRCHYLPSGKNIESSCRRLPGYPVSRLSQIRGDRTAFTVKVSFRHRLVLQDIFYQPFMKERL